MVAANSASISSASVAGSAARRRLSRRPATADSLASVDPRVASVG